MTVKWVGRFHAYVARFDLHSHNSPPLKTYEGTPSSALFVVIKFANLLFSLSELKFKHTERKTRKKTELQNENKIAANDCGRIKANQSNKFGNGKYRKVYTLYSKRLHREVQQ